MLQPFRNQAWLEDSKKWVLSRMLAAQHVARPRIGAALNSLLRNYSTTNAPWPPLPVIKDPSVAGFREEGFSPSHPVQFAREHFTRSLPAIQKWFSHSGQNSVPHYDYLSPFASTILPLELVSNDGNGRGKTFTRAEAPFSIWLEWSKMALQDPHTSLLPDMAALYLAQAPLTRLPETLQMDLPAPLVVLEAGKGDIYDANIWMGVPPTYTPLHRDPNPNLFVQLAGRKVVRLIEPGAGSRVFGAVQQKLGKDASKYFMGDEAMQGEERELLEWEVWCEEGKGYTGKIGYEAIVDPGAGVFIPHGWWHSIKGVDAGVTASVNWWFR